MDKKYRVIALFTDLQDGNYRYSAGDEYPRAGLVVTAERIRELASSHNKQGRPLIEEVYFKSAKPETVEQPPEEKPEAVLKKSDIMKMNVKELRKLAPEKGIENPNELTGSELKTRLIEVMGL